MKAIMTITNNGNQEKSFDTLYAIDSLYQHDKRLGVPDEVEIQITVYDEESQIENKIPYSFFLVSSLNSPFMSRVSCNNNRALSFFAVDIMGIRHPIRPQFKIDGTKITDEDVWYPEQLNIVDTKENFVVDGKSIISVLIGAKQIIKIEFSIMKRAQWSGLLTP